MVSCRVRGGAVARPPSSRTAAGARLAVGCPAVRCDCGRALPASSRSELVARLSGRDQFEVKEVAFNSVTDDPGDLSTPPSNTRWVEDDHARCMSVTGIRPGHREEGCRPGCLSPREPTKGRLGAAHHPSVWTDNFAHK